MLLCCRYLPGSPAVPPFSSQSPLLSPGMADSFIPTPPPNISKLINRQKNPRECKVTPSSLLERLSKALCLGTVPSFATTGNIEINSFSLQTKNNLTLVDLTFPFGVIWICLWLAKSLTFCLITQTAKMYLSTVLASHSYSDMSDLESLLAVYSLAYKQDFFACRIIWWPLFPNRAKTSSFLEKMSEALYGLCGGGLFCLT